MGPGAHLAKRLKRGDRGINRLDKIAKQHARQVESRYQDDQSH